MKEGTYVGNKPTFASKMQLFNFGEDMSFTPLAQEIPLDLD